MFALCKAMNWAHLPVAGGIYDQHPRFVELMFYLIQKENEAEERERKRQEQQQQHARKKR